MEKKIKKAAALAYNQGEAAPKISAMGKGEMADRIIKTAKENNVPIYENSELVETLLNFDIGQEIPEELYTVVAEILIFISNVDRIKGDANGK